MISTRPGLLLPLLLVTACKSPELSEAGGGAVRGPLASRTQHPVMLTFLAHRPRRAATQPEGTWGVALGSAYTTIFEVEQEPGQRAAFDGELWRNSVRTRYGIGERTDVEIEVAAVYTTSGFMDSFVDSFHELLLLPDGGREKAEENQFEMRLRRDGETIYELDEDSVGVADVPIVVTHRLRPEDRDGPGVAVRVGAEIPVGSRDRGYGNEEWDFGLGVLAERSIQRWTWTGAVDVIYTGDPQPWREAGVEANEIFQLQGGVEYRWSDRLSLLGQLFATSRITEDYDIEEIDRQIVDLGVGFAYDVGDTTLYGSVHEDLVAATGPDFTMMFGLAWGF